MSAHVTAHSIDSAIHRASKTALVFSQYDAIPIFAASGISSINCRAAGLRGMRPRESAVVGERGELCLKRRRVRAHLVAVHVVGKPVAVVAIADEVLPLCDKVPHAVVRPVLACHIIETFVHVLRNDAVAHIDIVAARVADAADAGVLVLLAVQVGMVAGDANTCPEREQPVPVPLVLYSSAGVVTLMVVACVPA